MDGAMDPQQQLMRDEVEQAVQEAFAAYDEPTHVLLYAASCEMVWQDLNAAAKMHPARLSAAIEQVEGHLRNSIERYLHE